MPTRDAQMPPAPTEIEIGPHTLLVTAIAGDQVNVSHPPGGVRIRGVDLEASDSFMHVDGDWQSWHETKSRFPLTVRPYGTLRDGSPAQRKSIVSLYRQAAEAFAAAHPELIAAAEVRAANNALVYFEADLAKAEKALNEAISKREEGLARERAALERLAEHGEAPEAPRM